MQQQHQQHQQHQHHQSQAQQQPYHKQAHHQHHRATCYYHHCQCHQVYWTLLIINLIKLPLISMDSMAIGGIRLMSRSSVEIKIKFKKQLTIYKSETKTKFI
uniref:Uncharacterized protein n=1 Tax=Bracon brevicornis TaxID=1563983 RepID=A0A6V7HVD1_9HYME